MTASLLMWRTEASLKFASGRSSETLILRKGRDGSAVCGFLGDGRGGCGILQHGERWDRLRGKRQ